MPEETTTETTQDTQAGETTTQETTGQQQAGTAQQQQQAREEPAPTTFEEYMAKAPTYVKPLIESHVAGLKSALADERSQVKKLNSELTKLTGQLQEGSELRTQLEGHISRINELQRSAEENELRAQFYLEASQNGALAGKSLELLYVAAKKDGFFDQKRPDWGGLKTDYPNLFAAPPRPATAAAGAGVQNTNQGRQFDMNRFIRNGGTGGS